MKTKVLFLAISLVVIFFSCKKEETEFQNKNVIPTDNPPVQLVGEKTDFEFIYLDQNDMTYDFLGTFSEVYYETIITVVLKDFFKVKGSFYFGFYSGNLYVSKSKIMYSIDAGTLSQAEKIATEKGYCLLRQEKTNLTNLNRLYLCELSK
jgi:hypothetical protein